MALTKITSSLVAINAIQGTLIADNAITAVHIAQNAITQTQIAVGALSDAIAANSITAAMIPNATAPTFANTTITGTLGVTGVISPTTHIDMPDGAQIKLGTGDDLLIYHAGNQSYVRDIGAGSLYLQSDSFQVVNAAGNETMMSAVEDGAVTLMYNDGAKFATASGGVSITGQLDLSSHLDMPDSAIIKLGTGDDLQLWHSSSHSFIRNTTGNMYLQDDGYVEIGSSSGEVYIGAVKDGTVRLYYDNAIKLDTLTGGINITGDTNTDTLTVSGAATVGGTLGVTGEITGTTATASGSTSTTALASTAFVQQELTTLIGGAPSTLNDLNELAAAINDDANYNSTLTTALATKLPLAGGTLTGDVQAPGIYVGSTNTSFDLYNNGTSYFNGAVTVDDNQTISGTLGVTGTLTLSGNILMDGEEQNDFKIKWDHGEGTSHAGISTISQTEGVSLTLGTNAYHAASGVVTVSDTNNQSSAIVLDGFNSNKIKFMTASTGNPSDRMTITSGGYVGIGGHDPITLLHLRNSSTASYPILIESDIDNDGGYTGIQFGYNGGSYTKAAIHVEGTSGYVLPDMHFLLNSTSSSANTQGLADAKMSILNNGNVGIGTASPDFNLDVEGSGTPTIAVRNSSSSSNARIHIGEQDTAAYGLEMRWEGNLGNAFFDNHYAHTTRPHMYFRMSTNGTPINALTIDPLGNIGIKTAIPKADLHIVTTGTDGHAFGGKSLSLTTSYNTSAQLAITLADHQSCYVKVFICGDWSSHSGIAFLGEYFVQNGAGGYAEPGVIIREVDHTHAADSISSQINDQNQSPANTFQIQFKLNQSFGTTTATGQLTYQIMGQFDTIT